MDTKARIRRLLEEGTPDEAIKLANQQLAQAADDELYYLRGNAFLKLNDWQKAIESYLEALELNPESPARETMTMANDILDFYNKDVYNQ